MKRIYVPIRLDAETVTKVDRLARSLATTRSHIVRYLVRQGLENAPALGGKLA